MNRSSQGRVLLVGDMGGEARALGDALQRQNYEVFTAVAASEASDFICRQGADVLVADAALPEGGAKALLEDARNRDPGLSVIVLAGKAETDAASAAVWAGASDWAYSPLRLAELLPKVARCAETSRLRRENAELRRDLALRRLAQTIAFSSDLDAVLERVADAAIGQGTFDEASIMLPEGPQGLRIAIARGPNRQGLVGQTVPLGAGAAGWVAENREPLVLHGPLNDPRIRPSRPPRPDIRCSMVVPLLAEGKLVGVLNVNVTSRRQPLAPVETQEMATLASTVAPCIHHSRLLRQLREAEEKFRAIFENASEGLYQKTLDGRFVAANPALAGIFGFASPDHFIAHANASPAGIYADEEDARRMKETLEETGEVRDAEVRASRRDGSAIWVRETARLVCSTPDAPARYEGSIEDITAKRLAEERLRASERRFRALFDSAADAIFIQAPDGRILEANAEASRRLGYAREELIGMKVEDLLAPQSAQGAQARVEAIIKRGRDVYETVHRAKNGGEIPTEISARAIEFDGDLAVLSVARDTSVRKTLEEQIRQMQKLNAVGHLAGGVAHDFNNLLTGISGLAQIVMGNLPEGSQDSADLAEIRQLALRGANLTRQLLAFSRRQPIKPQPVDLNDVVEDLSKMLRRLIGEDIVFDFVPEARLGTVMADPGQMEQVLMNLAVNACDAMPDGGTLTVETRNAVLDEEYCRRHAGAQPGEHVLLAVSDTGEGIDEAARQHLFEPFFTTKPQGKGTGLGLATAYGIVKQHGGSIWVYSEKGQGSTFKIYLPRAQTAQATPQGDKPAPALPRGRETVLLVEDEAPVRIVAERCLEALGYRVIAAASPMEALEAFDNDAGGDVALLLTDVVMPGFNGVELYERLKGQAPGLRVLYISGYTDRGVVNHKILEPGAPFLQKPFDPEGLAKAVRSALDG